MSRNKRKPIKRRFATKYFRSARQDELLASQGAASSVKGAVRATVVRVFMDGYPIARVYDRELDALLFTVRNDRGNLQVHFEEEQSATKLRRVK